MASFNVAPYLPTTRKFPVEENPKLETELSRLNIDVATAVNLRTIGLYEKAIVTTGNKFFNDSDPLKPRQSQRNVYTVPAILTGATESIAHGISSLVELAFFTWGQVVTDVPDFRNIPYVSAVDVTEQIEVRVDATNITIVSGAAAPNIVSGYVVLEFLQI